MGDLKICTFGGNSPPQLLCHHCGGDYMHHGPVEVQSRRKEDGPTASTVVFPDGEQTAKEGTSIMSSRRTSVVIGFWCEGCGQTSALVISQHKGCTFMGWANPADMDSTLVDSMGWWSPMHE